MTDTTPNLSLPMIAAAQAQKHVTHNEALLAIDALLQCAVLDKDLLLPPSTSAPGDRYIVAAGATGSWAGKSAAIATWQDGLGWSFQFARAGFLAFVADESLLYVFNGTAWTPLTSALTSIQNLSRLGIGTTADATNPFSAKLNKALWTAKTAAEGGDGDLRYVLNKETAAGVLSLLFQTGYSGRLEIGLVGSDDLSVRVSPDGSTWRSALTVDVASGALDFLSKSSTLASGPTCDLGGAPSRRVTVTGTTTITSFGSSPYRERLVVFSGALTLTHNATSLVLPGAANIVTAAGDQAVATSDGSGNWTVVSYTRASGLPIATTGLAPLASPAFTGIPTGPTPAAGTTTTQLATTAFVAAAVATSGGLTTPFAPSGRLTLTSATPVLPTGVSAAGTVYWTPYKGNTMPVWNGSAFVPTPLPELSNVLANAATGKAGPAAGAAASLYDLFVWDDAGTKRLTRGPAWTTSATRSMALSLVQGVYVNGAAVTNGPAAGYGTYVGTIATDGTGATVTVSAGSSAVGGGAAAIGLWNMYNRVSAGGQVRDANGSWTYGTAAWRAVDGSNNYRATFVAGLADDPWTGSYLTVLTAGTGAAIGGVGLDTTTAPSGITAYIAANTLGSAFAQAISQSAGQHFFQALENSSAGTMTGYGTFGNIQSGLSWQGRY